jgi:CBS domain containing-hemolysin-like protein
MSTDNPDPLSSNLVKKIANKIKKHFTKSDENSFDAEKYEQLDTPRKDMIDGIVRLSELNAKDIMIPRVDIDAIEVETDFKSLLKTIKDCTHSRIPVYEETIDNIVGILHVKDLIKLIPLSGAMKKFNLRKLIHEPFFVPETMPLDELLLEFKIKKLHLAIAVDEYGGLGGIVSLEDLLEVIVGDIHDEFDIDELPQLEKIGPNSYEVDSRMLISDFNEQLKLEIPTDNFDTIGGFVFDLFGRVPKSEEAIRHENISFKIKEISGIKIMRITVTIIKQK